MKTFRVDKNTPVQQVENKTSIFGGVKTFTIDKHCIEDQLAKKILIPLAEKHGVFDNMDHCELSKFDDHVQNGDHAKALDVAINSSVLNDDLEYGNEDY